jgi:hypothetical protein
MSGESPKTPKTRQTPQSSGAPQKVHCYTPISVELNSVKVPDSHDVIKKLFLDDRSVHFDPLTHVQKTYTESDNCLVPFNYGKEQEADEYAEQLKKTANDTHGSTNKGVKYLEIARHLRKLLKNFAGNKKKIFALMCQLSPDRYSLGTTFVLSEAEAKSFLVVILLNAKREVKKLWQKSCGEPEGYGKHKLINPKI